jgi:hypothetical protein
MKRLALSLAATLGISAAVFAAEPTTGPSPADVADTGTTINPKPDEAKPEKPWALTGGFDYLTQYMFRGYNTVPSGLIIQPYVDFSYTVYDQNEFSIAPHVGLWGDFTEKSGPREWEHFAEGDVTVGIGFGYKNFNATVNFNEQGYPSKYAPNHGEASEIQEMQLLLTYDDSACWEKCPVLAGLNPHLSYIQEIKDRNDHDNNIYWEVGLEPTFKEVHVGSLPVTFSVPLTVGLSSDSYYTDTSGHNDPVGYWLAGVKATIPIPVNEKWGKWSVIAECDYLRLESRSTIDANTGDNDDVIERVGVEFEF